MSPLEPSRFECLLKASNAAPIILKNAISDHATCRLINRLGSVPSNEWKAGDETVHSWVEYHLIERQLEDWCSDIDLLTDFFGRASSAVGWINRFTQGQWIDGHKDAGGDVQLVCALRVTSRADDGAIWVGDASQIIPMDRGDVLIFRASSLVHGTTMVSKTGEERVTLNLRFWW